MMRTFFIGVLLSIGFASFAQTPAHFIIGKKEFTGINIYDIHQDGKKDYWIASNNGLYHYDGYNFESIACSDQLSPSVFSPRSDELGNLYCYNLGGQIIRVDNNRNCEVYFQIPDSLLGPMIQLYVAPKGDLLIHSRKTFRIRQQEIVEIYPGNTVRFSLGFFERKNQIEMVGYNGDSLIKMSFSKNLDQHQRELLSISQNKNIDPINLIYQEDKMYLYQRNSGEVLEYIDDSIRTVSQCEKVMSRIAYQRGYFWGLSNKVGLSFFPGIENPEKNRVICFPNIKTSSFSIDHENNILLGTFGHGIIVIPESKIKTFQLKSELGKISEISGTDDASIAFGTNNGNIGRIYPNGKLELLHQVNSDIEFLEYLPIENELVVGCTKPFLFDLDNNKIIYPNQGNIKDAKQIHQGEYLFATDVGVKLFRKESFVKDNLLDDSWPQRDENNSLYNQRAHSIAFDIGKQVYYVGSLTGLKQLMPGSSKSITSKGHEIIAKEMIQLDRKVFVASKDQGIFVYENGNEIDHWTVKNGKLPSNTILTITSDSSRLYIATLSGIMVTDQFGNNILSLKQSYGLDENKPTDMVVKDNILWVLYQNLIQSIDLKSYRELTYKPEINLSGIYVNGHEVDMTQDKFEHGENKWSFQFKSKTLKYRGELEYQHRLNGFEEDWITSSFWDNNVEYKSLPPGNYEFQVKASFRDNDSDLESFAFEIRPPFWQTWWFYLAILVIVSTIFLLVFNIILKRQKKRAKLREELQESKLVAIQAQMNPHFIFNALNSIQDLVLKNEAEAAYNHISKFAVLVRNTLNQSNQEYVDFKEEIEALKVYLELEKLRFQDNFTYTIKYENNIEVMIPPMLIQPFVENAIVHGLLHKEGKKELTMSFELGDTLVCTIWDNGIGRKESKAIRQRQFVKHKSFASKAVDKRLEILSHRHEGIFAVKYIDHYDEGQPTGTSVVINIPFITPY